MMNSALSDIQTLRSRLKDGVVIPAMPLALDASRAIDDRHQRAVLRYYMDAGAGGIAVGVHTTQFEIRDPDVALFKPVLKFAADEIDAWAEHSVLKIAGVCGDTEQASAEASFVKENGYDAALLSLSAFANASIDSILQHCKTIANITPIIGFYMQTAVGGRVLPYEFWRQFAEIENVVAIKIAPFNRYQSLDVLRAVCDAGRKDEIAIYTGNDDNIVIDLMTDFSFDSENRTQSISFSGGLLGHWAVWTKKAVELLEKTKEWRAENMISRDVFTLAAQVTDTNAAFFDTANQFKGCIAGIHEVLRRQGIFKGIWCLNPNETLSPGQAEEIDRIYKAYPHLNDDDFVKENLHRWLL